MLAVNLFVSIDLLHVGRDGSDPTWITSAVMANRELLPVYTLRGFAGIGENPCRRRVHSRS